MTPTLAIVVVVAALTPRHHRRSSSARAATPTPVIVVVALLSRGLALLTNKEKNYVNEFRFFSLAWEMPCNGCQRPPNYYYDNCLAGVTSSLLVQESTRCHHGASHCQPLPTARQSNYYYDNECASELLELSE